MGRATLSQATKTALADWNWSVVTSLCLSPPHHTILWLSPIWKELSLTWGAAGSDLTTLGSEGNNSPLVAEPSEGTWQQGREKPTHKDSSVSWEGAGMGPTTSCPYQWSADSPCSCWDGRTMESKAQGTGGRIDNHYCFVVFFFVWFVLFFVFVFVNF